MALANVEVWSNLPVSQSNSGATRNGLIFSGLGTSQLSLVDTLATTAPLRASLWRLFRIVSAFTVGHSLTLLVGAAGWFTLPANPVKVLIAVSILVSAVHAIRPVFPGRETWVAAGFGLVHGLAFAGSIAELGFSPWHMVLSVLGFNVSIDLMQLAVVAATVPWLLILSRTRWYPPVRLAGALFGAVAALAWIGQRAFAWPNPVEPAVNALASHAL